MRDEAPASIAVTLSRDGCRALAACRGPLAAAEVSADGGGAVGAVVARSSGPCAVTKRRKPWRVLASAKGLVPEVRRKETDAQGLGWRGRREGTGAKGLTQGDWRDGTSPKGLTRTDWSHGGKWLASCPVGRPATTGGWLPRGSGGCSKGGDKLRS